MHRVLLLTVSIVLLHSASGCQGLPLFGGYGSDGVRPAALWSAGRTPHSVRESAQPFLVVPTVANPAQDSVFEELAEVRDEHIELRQAVDAAGVRTEQTESDLGALRIEAQAVRSELASVQQRLTQINDDLGAWKTDAAQLQNQLYEQQQQELQTLDELIRSVESILEETGGVTPPTLPDPSPAPLPTTVDDDSVPRPLPTDVPSTD